MYCTKNKCTVDWAKATTCIAGMSIGGFRWSNSREVLKWKNAKQIVHELYNDISISKDPKYSDILEVLQKVYLKLENKNMN